MSAAAKCVVEMSAQNSEADRETSIVVDIDLNCQLNHVEDSKYEVYTDHYQENGHCGDYVMKNDTHNVKKSNRKMKQKTKTNGDIRTEQEYENKDTESDDQMSKPKRKSRLSMNSDASNKKKLKENGSQGTIVSFFQKMSPKTEQLCKNLLVNENSCAFGGENVSNCVENKSKNHITVETSVKEVVTIVTNDLSKDDSFQFTENNGRKHTNSIEISDTSTKFQRKKKSLEFAEGESKSSKIDNKKKLEEPLKINGKRKKPDEHSKMDKKKKKFKEPLKMDRKKKPKELSKTDEKKKKSRQPSERDEKKKKLEKISFHKEKININRNDSSKYDKNTKIANKHVNVSSIEGSAKSGNCEKTMQKKNENIDENHKEKCEEKDFKKVRFSDQLQEFSPEPVRRHLKASDGESSEEESIFKNRKQFVKDEEKATDGFESTVEAVKENFGGENVNIFADQDDGTSSQESTEISSKNKIRNAFTFMMDSRHKIIGQNSEGKDLEKSETTSELFKEKKNKLLARKEVFQDWANMKGAKKRKLEDVEKGIIIENKLKTRAKRLKKMLTEKHPTEDVNSDDGEGKSEIVARKKKATRILESDCESTSNSCDIGNTESNSEKTIFLNKGSNKEGKHKRNLQHEKKLLRGEENEGAVSDEALDDEMFLKCKKPKLLVSSDSSSDLTVEDAPKDDLKKHALNVPLQQTELSSFFGMLNKSKKTKTKNKTKLQMNRNAGNAVKTGKNKKVKNNIKSKLTQKKNENSCNTTTSEDSSISHTEIQICNTSETETGVEQQEIQPALVDLENETKNSNIAQIQALLTPQSIKQWKMRLRVNLAAANDDEMKKQQSDMEDDSEVLQNIRRKPIKFVGSSDSDSDDEPLASKKYCKQNLVDEKKDKPIKLAPLFIKSKPKPKAPKLDEATIEARKRFLHSGIPDSLKKTIEKQQRVEEVEYQIFPTISHVTVKPADEHLRGDNIIFWALPKVDLKFINCKLNLPKIGPLNLGSVTSSIAANNTEVDFYPLKKINVKNHLRQIKTENLNYPVYRAFRFLHQKHATSISNERKIAEITASEAEIKRPKKGRPKKRKSKPPTDDDIRVVEELPKQSTNTISRHEIWTDLYKPSTSEEIFGNHASVSQFKTWLETWLEFSEEINVQRSKRNRRNSDSSDFESTDADSRDTSKLPGNTVILCGPHGSGKTTAVYTLCNELGINVLELNASSKRTGKRLLQELQEATQSHQVRENESSSLSSFLKREEYKTFSQNSQGSDSQSSTSSKKMCLLLIEDIDIVFEQDENFITALGQLLVTSKRPVVLTTTDRNCLHLRKFIHHPIINFSAFSAKILGTWLQVLCLVEGLHVDRQTIVELLERNRGDARSTLLQLQFWAQSGGQSKVSIQTSSSSSSHSKRFSVDENLCKDDSSNISWLNEEETALEQESTNENVIHTNCLESFGYFKKPCKLMVLPVDLGRVWWNLPHLFPPIIRKNKEISSLVTVEHFKESKTEKNSIRDDAESEPTLTEKTVNVNHTASKTLKNTLDIFETLAATDLLYSKLSVDCDFEPVHKNRKSRLKNGIELNECTKTFSSSRDLAYDWSNMLLDGYVTLYAAHERPYNLRDYSVIEAQHWRTTQNKCSEALSKAIPFISHLDHISVNTDYLSTLRTIARSEVIRASNNNKRRNRFYNYLRGIGISCNDSLFQTACNAFQHGN